MEGIVLVTYLLRSESFFDCLYFSSCTIFISTTHIQCIVIAESSISIFSNRANKRISVKIFLRLISPPCGHSWALFLRTKAYKGSLYLLVTLEKSLDIIFALLFLLESSKLCPVSKPPFLFGRG